MNWLVPFPVAFPLLMAAVLVAAAPICRRRLTDSITLLSSLCVTAACADLLRLSMHHTLVYWFGDWLPRGTNAVGISFVIDPIGAGMATLCGIIMTFALVYSWEYFDAVRTYFHALMLIFLAAMVGFCLTGDMFNLFVFFELMSVAAYALTAYKVEEKQSLIGGMNFAVTNSIAGFMVLIGTGLVYGRTGALNMAQAGQTLAQHPADRLVVVAMTLILCGFFVKAAAAPFHFWLADAHAVAPTPVCVLFSGVMIELGLFGGFRTFWTVFHPVLAVSEPHIREILMIWGAVTAVVGAVMCFLQTHIKRLLAFSSISHVGMMLAGAGCLTSAGFGGASLYVIGHSMVKGSLFMCAGLLLHQFSSIDTNELFGVGRRCPVLAATFFVAGLGLAGFPPFGLYLGKTMMEHAGKEIGQNWLPAIFLLCSALTSGAVLRAGGKVFLGWGEKQPATEHAPTAQHEKRETKQESGKMPYIMISTAIALAILPIATAFAGSRLTSACEAAARRFINQPLYAATVILGHPTGPVGPGVATGGGLAMGFAAAGGAIVLALMSLFGGTYIRGIKAPYRVFTSAAAGLNRLHYGFIGDLIVWLIVGIVIVGAAFAIAISM